jgi:tetratricopeptide (TPR) repeat protein
MGEFVPLQRRIGTSGKIALSRHPETVLREDFRTEGAVFRVETAYDDMEKAWVVNFFRSGRVVSARLYPSNGAESRETERQRAHQAETSVISLALELKNKLAFAKDAQAHMKLGYFFFVYQFYQEAEEELKASLSFFPDFPEALYYLGNVCHRTGKFNQAIACYEKACRLDSAYPDYANALGQVLLEAGQEAEAEQAFLTALKVNPNYLDARLNLAQLYLHRGGQEGIDSAFLSKAEELLRQCLSILEKNSPFPSINPMIYYDSLCRIFLNLKGKSGSRVDKSNLKGWCYLFNLAFRSGPELVTKIQVERYIERLFLENSPGFADLTNFLGVAYLFYARFFLGLAEESLGANPDGLIKKLSGRHSPLFGSLDF